MSDSASDHLWRTGWIAGWTGHIGLLVVAGLWLWMESQQEGMFLWRWGLWMLIVAGSVFWPAIGLILLGGLSVLGSYEHAGSAVVVRDLWLAGLTFTGMVLWGQKHPKYPFRLRGLFRHRLVWLMLALAGWVFLAEGIARWQLRWPESSDGRSVWLFGEALILFLLAGQILGDRRSSVWLCLSLLAGLAVRARFLSPAGLWREEDIAGLIAITWPLVIAAVWSVADWRWRWGVGIVAGLLGLHNLWVLLHTQNRAGAAALVAALFIAAVLSQWRWILVPVILAGLILITRLAAGTAYWQRFVDLLVGGPEIDSFHARLEIWKAAWRQASEHPWFGLGPGRFCFLDRYQAAPLGPHNHVLGMLAETGWVGLMLYIALFAGALIMLWRVWFVVRDRWPGVPARMLLASLCAYLLVGTFQTRHDMPLAYFLVGWALAMYRQVFGDGNEPAFPQDRDHSGSVR